MKALLSCVEGQLRVYYFHSKQEALDGTAIALVLSEVCLDFLFHKVEEDLNLTVSRFNSFNVDCL